MSNGTQVAFEIKCYFEFVIVIIFYSRLSWGQSPTLLDTICLC